MKNMKRAMRRHHRQRLINKVLKYTIATPWHIKESESDYEQRQDYARRHYNTVKNCSCYMCGNQRKIEGDSLQERRDKS